MATFDALLSYLSFLNIGPRDTDLSDGSWCHPNLYKCPQRHYENGGHGNDATYDVRPGGVNVGAHGEMFKIHQVNDEAGLCGPGENRWMLKHSRAYTTVESCTSQHLTNDTGGMMYFQQSWKKPKGLFPVMCSMAPLTRSAPVESRLKYVCVVYSTRYVEPLVWYDWVLG